MPPKEFLPITLTYIEMENLEGVITPTIQVDPDPAILGASIKADGSGPKSPFTGVLFITDDTEKDLYWVIEQKAGQHPKKIEIFKGDNSAQWKLPAALKNSHWKYNIEVWDVVPGTPGQSPLAVKDPEIHWGRRR